MDKLEEFKQKKREIYEKRYSNNKNLAIKGSALSTAMSGIYALNKFGSGSALAWAGQATLVVSGLSGFFYPDYRDCQLGRKIGYRGCDDREGYSYMFNGKTDYGFIGGKEVYGIDNIFYDLNGYSIDPDDYSDTKGYRKYGIAIVLRPYEKEPKLMCESFRGVYNQDEMLNDKNEKGWKKVSDPYY